MSCSSWGRRPVFHRVQHAAVCRSAIAAGPAVLAIAALLGGCSSYPSQPMSWIAGPAAPAQVAAATPAHGHQPAEDLEADGRAAQVPPSRRLREAPDDPSEPWSRNYGRRPGNPANAQAAPLPAQTIPASVNHAIPADLPADFRRRLAAALPDEE